MSSLGISSLLLEVLHSTDAPFDVAGAWTNQNKKYEMTN
jgi:hypothetical protein